MLKTTFVVGAFLIVSTLAVADPDATTDAVSLDTPSKVLAEGKAIDVPVGHAAPYLVDWNEDGKLDLLVGQFGEGKLRIFLNAGSVRAPSFEGFTYLQAGGADATVPAG